MLLALKIRHYEKGPKVGQDTSQWGVSGNLEWSNSYAEA
jgi:hypothetical protein